MRSDGAAAARRWVMFLAYLALTVLLSSQSRIPGADRVADVLLHAPEFAIMALLLVRALSGRIRGPHSSRVLAGVLGFGVLYGILDELHQWFVPGRHASVKDAAVDAAATGLTVLSLALLAGRASPRRDGKPSVELLTRQGCHLCEEARGVLGSILGPEGTDWKEIDIESDADLVRRYALEIPVLLLDGIKRFKGSVDRERLVRLLESRGRLRRSE